MEFFQNVSGEKKVLWKSSKRTPSENFWKIISLFIQLRPQSTSITRKRSMESDENIYNYSQ